MGGPALQSAFIEAGRLNRLDLFVMPVFLGGGVPLFTSSASSPRALALEDVERFPEGIVRLRYGMGSGV